MGCEKTPGPTCADRSTAAIDPGTRVLAASPVTGATGRDAAKTQVLITCELVLTRTTFSKKSTMGELSHRGRRLCYTLEDVERAEKVAGVTAIPVGSYKVSLTFSDRFQKTLPLLHNVPKFSGVRIHSGNDAGDTEGCILVGNTKKTDFVGDSRSAMKALLRLLEPYASASAGIRIRIEHATGAQASKK